MFVRLLTLFLLISAPAYAGADTVVSAPNAATAAEKGKVTIIDVRSPREWRQTGIPKGAMTVTIHNPNGTKAFIQAVEKAVGGDRSRPVALICAAGVRSARAVRILSAAGFKNLQNISEGMMGHPKAGPGWLNRGLPTNPCPEC